MAPPKKDEPVEVTATEPGKVITGTVLLQILGAAAGLTVFLGLVGAQMRRAAFEELGLPADRALGLIPKEELLAIGVHAVLPLIVYATLLTVGIVVALAKWSPIKTKADKPPRWLLGVLVVALAIFPILVVQVVSLHFAIFPGLVVVVLTGLAGAGFIWLVANGFGDARAIGWLIFIVTIVVGGVFGYVRTVEDPKLEPAALIRTGDKEGISGFLIAETSNSVYIAPLPPRDAFGATPSVDPRPDDIVAVPRSQIHAMRVAELAGFDPNESGPLTARALLTELKTEDAAAREPVPPDVVTTKEPEKIFAPLVNLHNDDPSYPTAADFFLENSWLVWEHPGDCRDFLTEPGEHVRRPAVAGPTVIGVDGSALGGDEPASHSPLAAENCNDDPARSFDATDLTRPGETKDRSADLPADEGFYLDLLNSKRGGDGSEHISEGNGQAVLTGVPAYYERQEVELPEPIEEFDQGDLDDKELPEPDRAVRLTYWLFYPLSVPPHPGGFGFDRLAEAGIAHEGDWERISVLLRRHGESDQYTPVSVRFHIHNRFEDVPWSLTRLASDGSGPLTHPIVFSAVGSHASYPDAGEFIEHFKGNIARVKDEARECPACPLWRTWEGLLRAKDQPWYGFGGAWGELHPVGGTGPLGPSTYKVQTEESLATELLPVLQQPASP